MAVAVTFPTEGNEMFCIAVVGNIVCGRQDHTRVCTLIVHVFCDMQPENIAYFCEKQLS